MSAAYNIFYYKAELLSIEKASTTVLL